ncbi:MAG: HAD-IIB family hydrolase [Betaproteobacteria bacterium]|nr:HAD-IIB family hydrolase [Betaproteobacteria bacterium]
MRPLGELYGAGGARGVFFDIDDTLTTDGTLTAQAYCAMERLKASGRLVVPITGRPAGWCDHIARMWPVDAVVGENGAFYFWHDRQSRKLGRRYAADAQTRAAGRARFDAIARGIVAAVPGCALASDQNYRESDLAIDFCEDVPALSLEAAARIAQLMRAEGMTAKISSIHVNGWFGDYDKLGMTKLLARERFGFDLDTVRDQFVFAGDSPNDAPMFGYFPISVGVANIARFAGHLDVAPIYVTREAAGAGFAELVEHLLKD